ncbi:hypothetical protein BDV93DRAFT_473781 [Ceratobasidium sp. AG-I]|nr:hypothetical protein BDV93DRAFT_473781 [Ceratobasidium sp. AG-I]
MDDQLELPTSVVPKDQQDEDEESSDGEGMPDWENIPGIRGLSRAVIPKRGEKEFEPAAGGATALQSHFLTKSRNAMFSALRGSRGANSKTISYAVWHPELGRAHVILARGTHFSALGHSALRQLENESDSAKPHKRLELMPEEALYLMERGSLFCWRKTEVPAYLVSSPEDFSNLEDCDLSSGAPMSVQQGFAEMIGMDGLTLPHYIIYAYLKRLGYTIGRSSAPGGTPLYPLPPPNNTSLQAYLFLPKLKSSSLKLIHYLSTRAHRLFASLRSLVFGTHHRGSIGGMLGLRPRSFSIASIFQSLRIINAGHDISLRGHPQQVSPTANPESFKTFWNVWKPSTPWRKLDVPKPDFEIAVVDARKTPVPDIYQLTELFGAAESRPPPPPRKRGPPNAKAATSQSNPPKNDPAKQPDVAEPVGFWNRVREVVGLQQSQPTHPAPKPNPFVHLKSGRKSVIVAAVDGTMISFLRFGEGDFTSWPMV